MRTALSFLAGVLATLLVVLPAWDGILGDDQIWKIVSFLKHSNKLPPEAKQAWQAAASNHS